MAATLTRWRHGVPKAGNGRTTRTAQLRSLATKTTTEHTQQTVLLEAHQIRQAVLGLPTRRWEKLDDLLEHRRSLCILVVLLCSGLLEERSGQQPKLRTFLCVGVVHHLGDLGRTTAPRARAPPPPAPARPQPPRSEPLHRRVVPNWSSLRRMPRPRPGSCTHLSLQESQGVGGTHKRAGTAHFTKLEAPQ